MDSFLKIVEPYILIFFIYSFLGWLMECLLQFIEKGKIVNRGFLIGPYCPIYGAGTVLITLLLSNYQDNIFVLFGLSLLICTVLEYLTSYIMEKLFKARWWDYKDAKFNLNGRVCLKNSILFGIAGVVVVKYFNNFLFFLLAKLNYNTLNIITIFLIIIFITDIIISYVIIHGFKLVAVKEMRDSTDEISKKVKSTLDKYKGKIALGLSEITGVIGSKVNSFKEEKTLAIKNKLKDMNFLYKRLVNAFPKFEVSLKKDYSIKHKIINDEDK